MIGLTMPNNFPEDAVRQSMPAILASGKIEAYHPPPSPATTFSRPVSTLPIMVPPLGSINAAEPSKHIESALEPVALVDKEEMASE
jgi:hypothetical protein